jgi:hypothetical protein
MSGETLITPPTEAYLNNHWAFFELDSTSLTRDEMRARIKDIERVTRVHVPLSCKICGAPFRARACCGQQSWNYKTIENMGRPL